MTNSIEMIIAPRTKEIGDGFSVKRLLPYMKKRMVGPFIFWDHMGPVTLKPNSESNVLSHPHIGLATITYLFSGEILHRDSVGSEQLINPGEVNWMTAGSGISHSERTKAPNSREMCLEGIQLWVALPKEHEDAKPSFVHIKKERLPLIEFGKNQFTLIAGEFLGKKSPVPVLSSLFYLVGELPADEEIEFELSTHEEGAIYLPSGELLIDDQKIDPCHLVTFYPGQKIKVKALQRSTVMIFGGKPFPEKRFIWWNFVSSSEEKIEQAKKAWKDRTFPQTIKETEFIPLPTEK